MFYPRCLFAILILGLPSVIAQSTGRASKKAIFERLSKSEAVLAECNQKFEYEYIAKFGTKPVRISHHCGPGCPVKLVKPRYPPAARNTRRSGEVVVEAIVDETGKVAYASSKKGSRIFASAAIAAIRTSEFRPITACNDKPVMFRRRILYRFSPGM